MHEAGQQRGRFVVLEHRWNGVHWDFMLERAGVLRTWAVDQPIVAGQVIPARALPDHRLAYLDYEGPVSGGRGAVRRVGAGTYRTLVWTERQIRLELGGSQLVGVLELKRVECASGPGAPAGTSVWSLLLGKVD